MVRTSVVEANTDPLFRTKICGITRAEDVEAVVAAGADAIGLNFYPKSRRFLAEELRPNLISALRAAGDAKPKVIGVFVNESADTILRIAESCSLDWIQLHGNERPDFSLQLPGWRILRAIGYSDGGMAVVETRVAEMTSAGCCPGAILLDAPDAAQFGGTGRVLPWTRLQSELAQGSSMPVPWVLAGGLTAENVGEAISMVRPDAVDVASGVESSPGQKDRQRVARFVQNARRAWQEAGSQ